MLEKGLSCSPSPQAHCYRQRVREKGHNLRGGGPPQVPGLHGLDLRVRNRPFYDHRNVIHATLLPQSVLQSSINERLCRRCELRDVLSRVEVGVRRLGQELAQTRDGVDGCRRGLSH
jgi:hypothetical protein